MASRPEQWVGLGFVATIENAPAEVMAQIDGIEAVATQIAWALAEVKPAKQLAYIEDLLHHDLRPVGWGWCDARDRAGAEEEGEYHAKLALDLGLRHFIANMEEPYDAHGDSKSDRFYMPDSYCAAFRDVAPHLEFAVTTTPRWASNHAALRNAGAVTMPQAFPLENASSVAAATQFCIDWGWPSSHIRPLCQVYETNGQVPVAQTFLEESAHYGVGLVPYILEQALGGKGRELLNALVPAIQRQPTLPKPPDPEEEFMEKIGTQHGITAFANWLRAQPGMPAQGAGYDPEKPGTWPWPDRLERTLEILAKDHDASE